MQRRKEKRRENIIITAAEKTSTNKIKYFSTSEPDWKSKNENTAANNWKNEKNQPRHEHPSQQKLPFQKLFKKTSLFPIKNHKLRSIYKSTQKTSVCNLPWCTQDASKMREV